MARNKNKPWMDGNRFDLKTAANAEKYICHETGLQPGRVRCHRTETFLTVNYMAGNQMREYKIRLSGGVLYCLKPADFKPLFQEIAAAKK